MNGWFVAGAIGVMLASVIVFVVAILRLERRK